MARAFSCAPISRIALGLGICMALFGCGADERQAEPGPPPDERHEPAKAPEAPPAEGHEAVAAEGPAPPEANLAPIVRLAAEDQDRIDEAVRDALRAHQMPGAVVVIGSGDGVLFRRAYGSRALEPARERMTVDTIFDLASLTKPLATGMSVMRLVDEGRLDLDASVATYLPGFDRRGKGRVTLRHLLLHTSGLPAVNPRRDYEEGHDAAFEHLFDLRLRTGPGGAYHYSDINYILLGEIVARVSGQSLDEFAEAHVFGPLAMTETRFRPPVAWRPRIAPTEERDDHPIRGDVHDPRAWRLDGVAGNAGLFSTADDLSRLARMMLAGGALDGTRILSAERHAEMTAPRSVPGGVRTLSWDAPSSERRARGYGARAYGHLGFTGTALWMDPDLDLFVLFLSNRVHPDGDGLAGAVLQRCADIAIVARARALPPPPAESRIQLGIDVLEASGFAALAGARVGLLTHAAARTRDGRRTLDVLAGDDGLTLGKLFSPEHGLASRREGRIRNGREAATGLRVISLFGPTRTPTAEMLEGIDTLVVDLQDVGVRYYTYGATVKNLLEAAAEHDLRLVILDRPNPLGGARVEGPVLDEALSSFVNFYPLPIRHGMTLGELATMMNDERDIGARLEVIGVAGWQRSELWGASGLPWLSPSPNLRTEAQVLLYPAVGLLESTPVSVGRGTDAPFELLGAPWMDGDAVVAALAEEHLPGVTARAVTFTPRSGPHRRARCNGVRLTVTDPEAFVPVRTGLALARALFRVHGSEWDAERLSRMIGREDVVTALERGDSLDAIEALYADDLAAFVERRARYVTGQALDQTGDEASGGDGD